MRRTPALLLAATTALLLTACTDGGSAPSTASADATVSADAAPPDEPIEPATPQCLVGTWQLDLPAMQDDLRTLLATDDGYEVEVAGSSTYDFAEDGGFSATIDSSSSLTISADGSSLTSRTTSQGDLVGRWSLEGDQLTISDLDSSGLEVTTTATMDDEELDVPAASAEDAIEALPPTSSTASCGEDRATLAMPLATDESSEPLVVTYTLRR